MSNSMTMRANPRDVKLSRSALPYVVPLVLLPTSASGPSEIVHSASGALVNTGEKRLLLTCHHVWSKFVAYREEHPSAAIAVGRGKTAMGCLINDIPLLEMATSPDLAILDFTESGVFEGTEQKFAEVKTWPPQRPSVGDEVLLAGYPGLAKRLTGGGASIEFNTVTLHTTVTAVGDRHIALADEKRIRRLWVRSDLLPTYELTLGGMSGGPLFVNRKGRYEFAGILYEGPDTDPLNTFFVSHADFITAQGRIDWARIPFN